MVIKKTVARLPLPAVLPLVEEVSAARAQVEGPGGAKWYCSLPCDPPLPPPPSLWNVQAMYIYSLLVNPQIETQHPSLCNRPRFEPIQVFHQKCYKMF